MADKWPINEVRCSHDGCTATLKGHAWSKIKSDWFFQKNGQNWCPDHLPEWVTEWRERKAVTDG